MPKPFAQVVLMGALTIILGSCAAKKLMVRNADTLLEYQLEKRLPLYSAQKKDLSQDIKKLLNENRREAQELLPVIDELNLESRSTEAQYKKLVALYDDVSLQFTRLLAKHMVNLDQKQQREMFSNLEEENRKLARKDPEERMDKVRERFKTFFGPPTEKQKQVLTEFGPYFEEFNQAKLKRRQLLFQRFKDIYASDLSPGSRQEMLVEAFKRYQESAHAHGKNVEMLKALLPGLSDDQRELFRRRMAEVKEILKLYLETDY